MHSHSQQLTTSVFTIISIISFEILWLSNLLFSQFEFWIILESNAFVVVKKASILSWKDLWSDSDSRNKFLKKSESSNNLTSTFAYPCLDITHCAHYSKCSALWSAKIYIAQSEDERRKKKIAADERNQNSMSWVAAEYSRTIHLSFHFDFLLAPARLTSSCSLIYFFPIMTKPRLFRWTSISSLSLPTDSVDNVPSSSSATSLASWKFVV